LTSVEEYNLETEVWDLQKHNTIVGASHFGIAAVPEKFFEHWKDETCKH
jgi:hypothetical protein